MQTLVKRSVRKLSNPAIKFTKPKPEDQEEKAPETKAKNKPSGSKVKTEEAKK